MWIIYSVEQVFKVIKSKGVSETVLDNPQHISQNLVQQVVNQLTGVGTCVSTGESAARTSWVLDQMVKGYYSSTD